MLSALWSELENFGCQRLVCLELRASLALARELVAFACGRPISKTNLAKTGEMPLKILAQVEAGFRSSTYMTIQCH